MSRKKQLVASREAKAKKASKKYYKKNRAKILRKQKAKRR